MTFVYDFYRHHKLTLAKERYTQKGLSGLVNMGNTCFLNSIIQCLSHTHKLTDFFLSCQFKKEDKDALVQNKKEWPFVMSYLNLMINIWESNALIKPKTFINALSNYEKKYGSGAQCDSHECLLHILEYLHKGLSYEISVEIRGEVKTHADKLTKNAIEAWTKDFGKNYSFIVDKFYGQFLDVITCKECNENETVFSSYNTIGVDIVGISDLEGGMEKSLGQCEINTWKCEHCGGKGCNKKTSLWSLPNYLIIVLKRFGNDNTKITNGVSFPLDDLDLTRFVSPQKEDPNNYIYTLYAVNYHSGTTHSGHYWSACKGIDDAWHMFNDGDVRKCRKSDIVSKDAYILFYYRKFIENGLSN